MSLACTTKSNIVKSIGDALILGSMLNRVINSTQDKKEKNNKYRCPHCGNIKKVNEAHFKNEKSIGCFTALIA